MKTRGMLAALSLAAIFPLSARMAEPDIEFTGVLSVANKTLFALTDLGTTTSRWISLGEEYHGYVLTSYDPKGDLVVLTKGAEEVRLHLRSPRVRDALSTFSPLKIEARRALWIRVKDLDPAAFLKAMAEERDLPLGVVVRVSNMEQRQEFLNKTGPADLEARRTRIGEAEKMFDDSVAAGAEPHVQQENLARLRAARAKYDATRQELEQWPKVLSDEILQLKFELSTSF